MSPSYEDLSGGAARDPSPHPTDDEVETQQQQALCQGPLRGAAGLGVDPGGTDCGVKPSALRSERETQQTEEGTVAGTGTTLLQRGDAGQLPGGPRVPPGFTPQGKPPPRPQPPSRESARSPCGPRRHPHQERRMPLYLSKDVSSFTFGHQMLVSHGGWCSGCFGFRFQKRTVTSQLSCWVRLLRAPQPRPDLVCAPLGIWLGRPSRAGHHALYLPIRLLGTLGSSAGLPPPLTPSAA